MSPSNSRVEDQPRAALPSEALERYRQLGKVWKPIFAALTLFGVLFSIHEIFRWGWVTYHENLYYYGMLAVFLSSSFLIFPVSSKAPKDQLPWYDVLLFLLTIACSTYLMVNAFKISLEGWVTVGPPSSTVVSIVMWGLVLEALRRGGGLTLVIFAGLISLYPLVAEHMPGFLEGTGWSFAGAAMFHVMTRESIIGIPTRTFHLEKVNKRWAAFAEEAQDRIAKTGKRVDLAKEWREIVEKEIGLVVD